MPTKTSQTTLANQLSTTLTDFIASQSTDAQQTIGESFQRLMDSDVGAHARQTGDSIPEVCLPNARGEITKLADKLSAGPIVLNFYRGGWCPFCNLELKALTNILPEIQQLGAQLIGISPETPDTTQQTVNQHGIAFEVLSDLGNKTARSFGLVMQVYESMRPLYLQWGLNLPAANGDDSWEIPIPATYVVDQHGIIRAAYVDKDYTKRMEPSEIVRALEQIK